MGEGYGRSPAMTVTQLRQLVDTGEPFVLLDVREPLEWSISNLGAYGATLIPLSELPDRLAELDPASQLVVYCRTGARSDMAVRFLMENGFDQVWNLAGGINAWAREIEPGMSSY
jgi:adenylyltransferase/sulfurtransferase